MPKIDLKNIAILIDFDGTITIEDTNDKLVEDYWNSDIEEFFMKNNERDMKYVEFMDGLFSNIKITEEEYLDFILSEIDMTRGFLEFYKKVREYNIPIAIISGGFDNGILPFLKKHGIEDVQIYANHLNFNGDNLTIDYFHDRNPECCHIGLCGNCKITHVKEFKERYKKVLFIGDGITDEPIANRADIVFAKEGLLKYCKEHDLDCISWEDFFDVERILFSTIGSKI
ncbi:MtnX-like HAD-IB family phosphatase [Tissierellaceae bacterium HCP3S3_D8]